MTQDRQQSILEYLKNHNLATVDDLVQVTGASAATIRRDLIKLNKGDVKTDYNIDIFDFLRKIVGMAINLTEKPEKEEEDNNPDEKRDLDYIGLSNAEAVEKFVEEIIQKYKERDMKEKKK